MRKLIVPLTMAFALGAFGTSAMADNVEDDFPDDVIVDDFDDDDSSPAVPEPGAALAMGAGLATIAFALRRRR